MVVRRVNYQDIFDVEFEEDIKIKEVTSSIVKELSETAEEYYLKEGRKWSTVGNLPVGE